MSFLHGSFVIGVQENCYKSVYCKTMFLANFRKDYGIKKSDLSIFYFFKLFEILLTLTEVKPSGAASSTSGILKENSNILIFHPSKCSSFPLHQLTSRVQLDFSWSRTSETEMSLLEYWTFCFSKEISNSPSFHFFRR